MGRDHKKYRVFMAGFEEFERIPLPQPGVFIAHDFSGRDNKTDRVADAPRKVDDYRLSYTDGFIRDDGTTEFVPVYAPVHSGTILQTLCKEMINTDAGIFDVSFGRRYNANVLIELGISLGINHPTIVVAEEAHKPLLDFLDILKPVYYKNENDLAERIGEAVRQRIYDFDSRLSRYYCTICQQKECRCRKNYSQEENRYWLAGAEGDEKVYDDIRRDMKHVVRTFNIKPLDASDDHHTQLCNWLYHIRKSRFALFYSQSGGKHHHGAENAETMVQLGMAIGAGIPWRLMLLDEDEPPTDLKGYVDIRVVDDHNLTRSNLMGAVGALKDIVLPYGGIEDILPIGEWAEQEPEPSIDEVPIEINTVIPDIPEDYVYISYVREDIAFANQLRQNLIQAGLDVWSDSDIQIGENWQEQIERAIAECVVPIVLVSKSSIQNKWATFEFELMKKMQKPFFSIAIEPINDDDILPSAFFFVGILEISDYQQDLITITTHIQSERYSLANKLSQPASESMLPDQLQETIRNLEKALRIYQSLSDTLNEALVHNYLGYALSYSGDKKRALGHHENALKIYEQTNSISEQANELSSIGILYYELGEIPRAIGYYEKSVALYRSVNDLNGQAIVLNHLGGIYFHLKENEKARNYLEEALSLTQIISDKFGMATTLNMFGSAILSSGEPQKAIEYYEQALALRRDMGDRKGEGQTLSNIGNAYKQFGDKLKAREYYEQSLLIFQSIGDKDHIDLANFNIQQLDIVVTDNSLSDDFLPVSDYNDLEYEDDVKSAPDSTFARFKRGDLAQGKIISSTPTAVTVDLGEGTTGIIPGRELERMTRQSVDELKKGKQVTVYVVNPYSREGTIILSVNRAIEELDWQRAETFHKSQDPYEANIAGYNKGGLIVRFGRLRGFIPESQLSDDRKRLLENGEGTLEDRYARMTNEPIVVKVMEVDRSRNRLILSERTAVRERRERRKESLIDELTIGQIIPNGRVVSIEDFGVFVDIGGAEGLVHLTEISWKHVTNPKEVLKIGQTVKVEVISIDRERRRIGLSIKSQEPDPWDEVVTRYQVGDLVNATVTKMTKFGAFARLVGAEEIEGLIHISELSDKRVMHPKEVVKEGEELSLRVVKIDLMNRRLGLSLKRVNSPEWLDRDLQRYMSGE